MSGSGVSLAVAEFLGYWQDEGERYARHGDYAWMASLVPGRRVLEIGCGPGFSTQALAARGLAVLALDALPECLAATQARVAGADVTLLAADLAALTEVQRGQIAAFAPNTVVCWLMGAPAETTGAQAADAGQAVVAYREKMHRLVAELAASLPTVRALHLVDRTVIPWQAKDIGRDTLVGYHLGKTLRDLPFTTERRQALYRKLEDTAPNRGQHPALKGAVPTLASLLAERNN
ncbi:MAG: class I SAM-dependent methyltransferase [Azonexus sp.]|jgi:SAM-dependent methyltransferase|uniref:class I SAM-dependent methyltransferase n=1 Tax=Azonexus sp. TaxID=1872668 RepID=UPI00282DD5D2|nr:class I SAM-dependent methyltransferase [Azonexus sp.]MDR0776572.1 class I SAM-dependent methyltransferase [Azonexus sp.]